MELKELQGKAAKIFLANLKRDKIDISSDYLVMKITEELGEFVQSYIIHEKKCRPSKYLPAVESKRNLSKELADVLGLALVISKVLKIDLEEALVKKWITREWMNKSK